MKQTLKAIEWNGVVGDPMYFLFSDSPVATTEAFAAGNVNIDVDGDGKVVGVELLSGDVEDFAVFLKIAETRGLDLSGVHLAPHLLAHA